MSFTQLGRVILFLSFGLMACAQNSQNQDIFETLSSKQQMIQDSFDPSSSSPHSAAGTEPQAPYQQSQSLEPPAEFYVQPRLYRSIRQSRWDRGAAYLDRHPEIREHEVHNPVDQWRFILERNGTGNEYLQVTLENDERAHVTVYVRTNPTQSPLISPPPAMDEGIWSDIPQISMMTPSSDDRSRESFFEEW